MNLYTVPNLILLAWAHFLLFFVPAAAIAYSIWKSDRKQRAIRKIRELRKERSETSRAA